MNETSNCEYNTHVTQDKRNRTVFTATQSNWRIVDCWSIHFVLSIIFSCGTRDCDDINVFVYVITQKSLPVWYNFFFRFSVSRIFGICGQLTMNYKRYGKSFNIFWRKLANCWGSNRSAILNELNVDPWIRCQNAISSDDDVMTVIFQCQNTVSDCNIRIINCKLTAKFCEIFKFMNFRSWIYC